MIDDVFVINPVAHSYNLSDANLQPNPYAHGLRKLLVDHPLRLTGENVSLTASIGVTLLRSGESPEVALGRADQAMYQAKSEGRNRVVSVLAPVVPEVRAA